MADWNAALTDWLNPFVEKFVVLPQFLLQRRPTAATFTRVEVLDRPSHTLPV